VPFTDPIITKFSVDDREYLNGLDRIGSGLRDFEDGADKAKKSNKALLASFTDIKSAAEVVASGLRQVVEAMDEAYTTGQKYNQLQRANKLPIDAAARSTKGLIGNLDLLQASSRASTYQLNLTKDAFAELAKGAVILGQKTGVEATEAFNRLIQGSGKMEQELLDELGLVVRADTAYAKYAETLGKTAQELTAVEKRMAFLKEVTEQVTEKTKGQEVDVKGAGAAWAQMKVGLDNVATSLKGVAADSESDRVALQGAASAFKTFNVALRASRGDFDTSADSAGAFADEMERVLSLAGMSAQQVDGFTGALRRFQQSVQDARSNPFKGGASVYGSTHTGGGTGLFGAEVPTELQDIRGKRGKVKFPKGKRPNTRRIAPRPGEMNDAMTLQLIRGSQESARRRAGATSSAEQTNMGLAGAAAEAEQQRQRAALAAAADVQRQFDAFQSDLTSRSEGMSLLERMLPEAEFDRVTRGLQRLSEHAPMVGNAITNMADAAGGAFHAAGNALFDMVATEKSAGTAFREAFHGWLSAWGRKMSFKALEAGGEALLMAAIGNFPGAAKAGAAAVAFTAAAAAAGLGARALAPESKTRSSSRGVDRGVGGPASSAGRSSSSATFVYNVNTIIPPDEDEAAATVSAMVTRAQSLGFLAA